MSNLFFEKINNINWFSNCGNELFIENCPIKIQFLSSFNEMGKGIKSDNWDDAILEAQNRLTSFLHKREHRRYNEDWNKITLAHKEKLKSVEKIAKEFADQHGLGKDFVDSILWNVLGASMEEYYYSINRKIPIFFKYLMEIYSRGNLPCGIVGEIEEEFSGKQIDFSQFTLLVY